jgi:hypothetical protein
MSTNPVSMRFPLAVEGKAEPEIVEALQYHDDAITDLQQAIPDLKSQIDAVTATASATAASSSSTTSSSSQNVTNIINNIGFVNPQQGVTSYSTVPSDEGALILLSDASPIAVTLTSAGSVPGIILPWYAYFLNLGTGTATLTPASGTISYPGNISATSMPVATGTFALVYFDGTNFWASSIVYPTVTGSGTTGFVPVWTSSTVLGNSHIDDGITVAGVLTSSEPTLATNGSVVTSTLGASANQFAQGGVASPAPFSFNVADIQLAGVGVIATNSASPWTQAVGFGFGALATGTPSTSQTVCFGWDFIAGAEFPLTLGFSNQIYIVDGATTGFVGIATTTPAFQLDVAGDINAQGLVHSLVYSAAGTPIPPAATAGAGASGFVSDATLPAAGNFGAAYTSGGANFAPVYCDGANWFIG